MRNIPDVERIMAWIKDCRRPAARSSVGGGYIGLEMAEQLKRRGLGVTVVEALPQVMTPLDPEMAAWLHAGTAKPTAWKLHLGDPVAAFEAPKAGESARASVVVLKSGKTSRSRHRRSGSRRAAGNFPCKKCRHSNSARWAAFG